MSKGSNRRPTNQLAFYESFDRIFRPESDPTNFCDAHDMRLVENNSGKKHCPHCEQARMEISNGKS
jgi:hypothetical protein